MKKFDRIILLVFLYGLPIVIVDAIAMSFYNERQIDEQAIFLKTLYSLSGLVFGIWMSLALYICIRLLTSLDFREIALTKLSLFKERDEREVLLSGRATKTSFLTTMAILIFLLCLSVFTVSVYHVTPEYAVDGKTGKIALGLKLDLTEDKSAKQSDDTKIAKDLFTYSGLPISKQAVILFLILWQILSYNYSVHRFQRTKKQTE